MMKHLWGNDVDAKMGYEDERKDETGIPTWTTEPLENDLEITGPTTLYFWAKTDFIEGTFIDKAKLDILMSLLKKTLDLDNDNDFFERLMRSNDVQWSVRMNDVFPDGRSKNITQGWIRASCRPYDPNEASGVKEHSLDPAYVPYDPFYLRPTETPKPINEGQLYQYAIEILPTGNVFKKGHRIRIDLANSDFPHLLPILTPSNNTIVIDDAHEARIDYTTVNTNDEGKTWKWITKPGEKGYSKDFTSFDQYLMKNVDPEEKTEPSPVPEEAQQPSSSDEKSGWCFISASQFLK
jgi:predicted acyl esterase